MYPDISGNIGHNSCRNNRWEWQRFPPDYSGPYQIWMIASEAEYSITEQPFK
jgi:hypothetical protein